MASKSAYQAQEKGAEIEEQLDQLEKLIDRLRVMYEQYFLGKVAADAAEWRQRYAGVEEVDCQVRVIDGYVGEGYGVASPQVFALIAELAALEGVVLDPVYTGKAFAGLVAELAAGRFAGCRDIVFVHTGGIFGLFPQRQGFHYQ